ncbi:hypothetical protein POF45_01870 [Pseudomonas sp. 681]|uniref:Uncharacterized protein n=1 Tax=Pseudomonas fungipugnans TaxID=3024217 RepID=A0ABT6QH19_9PSED|nr:hypothetical protein [Pseudomonas sp. 681]MDI2590178.1 hypothetical protein [Pseudomonas sp. 681]
MDSTAEAFFSTSDNPEEIFPEKALGILPFSATPILAWEPGGDLFTFLFNLLEGTGYEDNAGLNFVDAIELGKTYAEQFQTHANHSSPAPGSLTQELTIPDFEADPLFGRVVKALVAWNETVGNILSEAGYFSLAHMLETRSDLHCSMELASGFFYRQSLQVLRGFIESVILPIHLCKHPSEFSQWKANSYRTPSIAGKNGIARLLQRDGVITEKLAEKISDTYSLLNGYIHGSEEALNNTGLNRGAWEGHVFQPARYQAWAEVLISLIEVSLPLLKINLVQWATVKAGRNLFCSICHGSSLGVVQRKGDLGLTLYRCVQCTNTFWKDDEGSGAVSTSVVFEDD